MKRIISLSFALLAVYAATAPAATRPVPADYVENQIIVKFHKNTADVIEMKLAEDVSTSELKLSRSLNSLNKKYRLKKAKPLFKNFKKRRQRIKTLLTKDRALLTKKEKRILRRLKRARKGARVPALDRIYKIDLDLEEGQSLEDVVAAYNDDPDVEYAELNYIVSICKTPNDPLHSHQWALPKIDAPQAWDIYTGSSEIIVAVIDTGVDYTHRDIDDNMWVNIGEIAGNAVDDDGNGYVDDIYGYDFCNYDSNPKDDHGHGTHCGGIIAAEGDNGLDISGVCWDAKIMALKFLDASGYGWTSDAVEAFYYAVENGADITSNSWGGDGYSQSAQDAINYAHSQGVIMVAGAGNNNSTNPFYPAYYDDMISVAATNSNDQKASFSNYGDWVDIAAPGVDVLSLRASGTSMRTVYDDYTTIASGTSMACPHVAGACALLMAISPEARVDELEQSLTQAADPIAPEISIWGRLNVHQAAMNLFGSQGHIYLDNDFYSCSALIEIALFDSDLKGAVTQDVNVTTDGGDYETLVLSKTDILGVFKGTISTDSGAANTEDSILQVSHGQIITATYEDPNDGTGNPATATDTAVADCESPVIFNVQIEIHGVGAKITFETNEPTTARVLCSRLSCGGPNVIVKSDTDFTISHSIKLLGLSPDTEYYFIVETTDAVGNKTVDDNSGACYSFTTSVPLVLRVPAEFATIQAAIDEAWGGSGETVLVADGTYRGSGNRDLDFHGKALTVCSENGPENCIIDCNGTENESHRGFYFHSSEDRNSVVDGLTIINGIATNGGGIHCTDGSSPTLSNCIFSNNWSGRHGRGGGMYSTLGCAPTVTNCIFMGNSAESRGGGMYNGDDCSPIIINCAFVGNSVDHSGGGMHNEEGSYSKIINCKFIANTAATKGAGLNNDEYSYPTLINCTFSNNSAGRWGGGMYNCEDSISTLKNCIFWENSPDQICLDHDGGADALVTYSDIQGAWPGLGNIDVDPQFADPCSGDYHLLPESVCIDAGDPDYIAGPNETDLDGFARVFGGRIDMGAYEFSYIESRLRVFPQVINRHSRMKRIMAWVHLPRDITKEQVDEDWPILLYYPDAIEPIEPIRQYVFQHGRGKRKRTYVLAYYDKAELMEAVGENRTVELEVMGRLKSGQYFRGCDSVRINGRRGRRWQHWFRR